jgi:hypothetical protein
MILSQPESLRSGWSSDIYKYRWQFPAYAPARTASKLRFLTIPRDGDKPPTGNPFLLADDAAKTAQQR